MMRQKVISSNIVSIGYDENTQILEIEFKQGAIYRYSGVPAHIFQNLMEASSHGTYFHAFIRNRFVTIKVS